TSVALWHICNWYSSKDLLLLLLVYPGSNETPIATMKFSSAILLFTLLAAFLVVTNAAEERSGKGGKPK
ncbi:hypothetical protein MTO96_046252, partial [Rhipicephalus appendiculatus]